MTDITPDNPISFSQITLTGEGASKFLQGQLTCNVDKLNDSYQATAICNIKGRVDFGIWIKTYAKEAVSTDNEVSDRGFSIITSTDCMVDLMAHIKKYGAFSKITVSDSSAIYPTLVNDLVSFTDIEEDADVLGWMSASIATANYWITKATQGQFQPQELRLHQRDGVDYDKGCYLGQEVIARLYFKASPKAYLHRIAVSEGFANSQESLINQLTELKIQPLNMLKKATGYECLVVTRPENIQNTDDFKILTLPANFLDKISR